MKRVIILVILGAIFLTGVFAVFDYFSKKPISIDSINVSKVNIYTSKGYAQTSPKTTKTIKPGAKNTRLKSGDYVIYYYGSEGFSNGEIKFNVPNDKKINIQANPSTQVLASNLNSELPLIQDVLKKSLPNINLYKINAGQLLLDGSWYVSTLTYDGGDDFSADTLRFIMHKVNNTWILETKTPEIIINSNKYKNIPKSVVDNVNIDQQAFIQQRFF